MTSHYPIPKPSPEAVEALSVVRRMEAKNEPLELIQAAYDHYWDVVDRERLESEKACKAINAENARLADERRKS